MVSLALKPNQFGKGRRIGQITPVTFLLIAASSIASESDMDEFSEILGWEQNWNTVVDRSVNAYWDRAATSYLSYLTDEQKSKAMPLVKESLKGLAERTILRKQFRC